MQTAIQEEIGKQTTRAKEALRNRNAHKDNLGLWSMYDIDYVQATNIIVVLQSLLPAERSMVCNAFNAGANSEYDKTGITASDYYLTTFTVPDGDKTDNNG